MKIEKLKQIARQFNAKGQYLQLGYVLAILDQTWHDHKSAMAFYTELEQARTES